MDLVAKIRNGVNESSFMTQYSVENLHEMP